MDFTGFGHCWNIWENVSSQINKMSDKGIVIFRHFNTEFLHIKSKTVANSFSGNLTNRLNTAALHHTWPGL